MIVGHYTISQFYLTFFVDWKPSEDTCPNIMMDMGVWIPSIWSLNPTIWLFSFTFRFFRICPICHFCLSSCSSLSSSAQGWKIMRQEASYIFSRICYYICDETFKWQPQFGYTKTGQLPFVNKAKKMFEYRAFFRTHCKQFVLSIELHDFKDYLYSKNFAI